jgi:hypothetical protein
MVGELAVSSHSQFREHMLLHQADIAGCDPNYGVNSNLVRVPVSADSRCL